MRRQLFLALGFLAIGACGSNNDRPAGFGTFSLTWDVQSGGVQIDCASVNAVTLQLTSIPVGGGAVIKDKFDCSDFAGTTDPLPEGDYHLKIDLLDSNNQQLNDLSPTTVETIVRDTDLNVGNFIFDFNP